MLLDLTLHIQLVIINKKITKNLFECKLQKNYAFSMHRDAQAHI